MLRDIAVNLADFRIFCLRQLSERSGKIHRPDDNDADARGICDGINVFDSFACFNLHQLQNVFVRFRNIFRRVVFSELRRAPRTKSADAIRRIQTRAHGIRRIFRRFDHREDQPICSHVKNWFCKYLIIPWNPDKRRNPAGPRSNQVIDQHGLFNVCMLRVDPEVIEAGISNQLREKRIVAGNVRTDQCLAAIQPLQQRFVQRKLLFHDMFLLISCQCYIHPDLQRMSISRPPAHAKCLRRSCGSLQRTIPASAPRNVALQRPVLG